VLATAVAPRTWVIAIVMIIAVFTSTAALIIMDIVSLMDPVLGSVARIVLQGRHRATATYHVLNIWIAALITGVNVRLITPLEIECFLLLTILHLTQLRSRYAIHPHLQHCPIRLEKPT